MTPDDMAQEFYGYAHEVWSAWAARAGWRGVLGEDDSIQAAVAHCWAVRGSYRPDLSSRRTFFGLCARRCITDLAQKARRRHAVGVVSLDERFPDGGLMFEVAAQCPQPCEHAGTAELMDTIARLPAPERYALEQHAIRGRSLDSIAAELGVSREGVRKTEIRALKKLATTLGRGMLTA